MQPDPVESVPALALERVDQVDAPSGGKVRCRGTLIERDRFRSRRPIAKVEKTALGGN